MVSIPGSETVRSTKDHPCDECGAIWAHDHHDRVAEIVDEVTEYCCVFGDHMIPSHQPHWRFTTDEVQRRGCLGCVERIYAQARPVS